MSGSDKVLEIPTLLVKHCFLPMVNMETLTNRYMTDLSKLLFACSLVLMLFSCREEEIVDQSLNEQDRAFLREATYINQAEIEMGELATAQGQNDAVQGHGQQMVTFHTSAQGELNGLANLKGEAVPDTLQTADLELLNQLSGLEGFQFDSAYLHHQVIRHGETRSLFQGYVENANDPDLLDYAVTNLADVIIHQERAEELREGLTGGG